MAASGPGVDRPVLEQSWWSGTDAPWGRVYYGFHRDQPDKAAIVLSFGWPQAYAGQGRLIPVVQWVFGGCVADGRRFPAVRQSWFKVRHGGKGLFQAQYADTHCMGPGGTTAQTCCTDSFFYDWATDTVRSRRFAIPSYVASRVCDGSPTGPVPVILGTPQRDVLTGTGRDEIIDGRGGDDVLRGGGGRDIICAGAGDDVGHGGPGFDFVIGQAGADNLHGGRGRDVVTGDSGAGRPTIEELRGGHGDDIIVGGLDTETRFLGQSGNDRLISQGTGRRLRFDGGVGTDLCIPKTSTNTVFARCEWIGPSRPNLPYPWQTNRRGRQPGG